MHAFVIHIDLKWFLRSQSDQIINCLHAVLTVSTISDNMLIYTVNFPPISAEITGRNKHNILCNVSSEGVRVKNTGSVALMSIIPDMYYVMNAFLNPNDEYQASVWMLHKALGYSNSAIVLIRIVVYFVLCDLITLQCTH